MLESIPKELTPGGTAVVEAEYNLATANAASISAALMRKGPNMPIATTATEATKGQHTVKLSIPIPADAPKEAVYIVVTMTPAGGSWEDRLAEDRSYGTRLAGVGRMLRTVEVGARGDEGEGR